MLDAITPVILTLNEEANIERTLANLRWAREVVVVDSSSTDATKRIACSFPNVRWFEREFDSLASQWNFAIHDTGIDSEWILALDADYMAGESFVSELSRLRPHEQTSACEARFTYCIAGRPLRGSLYPPVKVLFRRVRGSYVQDGHAHRLVVDGEVHRLAVPLLHDDRKPLSHWLASQNRYMDLEVEKLEKTPAAGLTSSDRLRKLLFLAPFAAFLYALVIKGALLDGWPGLVYALERLVAEAILSMKLIRRRLGV